MSKPHCYLMHVIVHVLYLGFMFLWRALETVSDSLEYFKLNLVTPMYSVIEVEIPKAKNIYYVTQNGTIYG